jgi:hypothetical protein
MERSAVLMTQEQILDEILPGLADSFEAGNRHPRYINPSTVEAYEPLRERIAGLIAEGSLADPLKMKAYHLTSAGYVKYKARVTALRTLRG